MNSDDHELKELCKFCKFYKSYKSYKFAIQPLDRPGIDSYNLVYGFIRFAGGLP